MALPTWYIVDNASALLFLALAAFVARVTPSSGARAAFVAYLASFSVAILASNSMWLTPESPAARIYLGVAVAAWLVASGTTVWLARVFPRPLDADEKARIGRARHVVALVAVAFAAANIALIVRARELITAEAALPAALGSAYVLLVIGTGAFSSAAMYLAPLLALRFAAARAEDDPMRGQAALGASAMLLFPLLILGIVYISPAQPLRSAIAAGGIVFSAGAWVYAAQAGAGARALARNVAWLALVIPLLGMVAVARAAEPLDVVNSGIMGAGRTLGVLLLAYAMVRHHLLGVDVKLRWTISRGTTAAVFVAVFFLVSEGAQEFFELRTGSGYWGIAAASVLVFAIAPIQRLAERVAEHAVPPAQPPRREETYRATLRRFLRDGAATHEEERVLANLAADLGIDAARAFELRAQVQAELPAAARDGDGALRAG
ncbi:MAG TPA: hypothetical protein VM582_07460 [Candidatus Thermoplasmatota archaeon]|nr:hypothetical protein [Candidatus Thermoplasmatota archaeon]